EKKQENSNSTAKLFNALGVDEVEKVSFEWIIPPSRSILNVRIQRAPGKTTGKGFWKLLTNDPLPRSHYLQYVPDDIMSYQVVRLNLPAFWEELPAVFAAMGPQAATQFQMGLKSISGMLQVDISRDFIANLDTILTYYSRLDGITDTTLYIWQLRDSRAMEKTLGKIFAENAWLPMMLKDNFQRLDLGEYNIYSIKLPQFQMPKEDEKNAPTVEYIDYGFTVIDGDFVFGRINMIRSYIHGTADKSGGRKFYRSPLYKEMNRHVPDDAVGYGLVDITPYLESGLNLFKSIKPKSRPQQQTAAGTPTAVDPLSRFFENLRFDRLPPHEFLRSFFTPWTNTIQFNGNQYII
ncbi:MAG: hypothetical protein GY950_37585, partial [bacterium]|nr:hypothetical protein [bacterium]